MTVSAVLLGQLLKEPRLAGRKDQLKELADALKSGAGLDKWAEIDLYAAFLRDETIGPAIPAGGGRGRLLRAWDRVLDDGPTVLIFLPIAVTWAGLLFATRAYRESRNDPALANKSFLERWQSGFGGRLAGWLSFDRVALYTLLAIGLLVVMSLWQLTNRRRTDQRDEAERAELLRRLAEALTAAQLELAPVRLAAPGQAAAELGRVAGELAGTVTHIRRVGEVAERAQREALAGLAVVGDAVGKVEQGTIAIQAVAVQVGQAAQQVGDRLADVGKATTTIADAAAEFARQADLSSDRLRKGVHDTIDGLADRIQQATAESQRKITVAVGDSSATIAKALDTGADQVRTALVEVRTTGAAYTHRVESAVDVLGQVTEAVAAMPDSVQELSRQLGQATTDLPPVLTGLGDRLVAATANLPGGDQDQTRQLRLMITELKTSLDELRAAVEALGQSVSPRSRWWWGR
jgi:hypothetical protein